MSTGWSIIAAKKSTPNRRQQSYTVTTVSMEKNSTKYLLTAVNKVTQLPPSARKKINKIPINRRQQIYTVTTVNAEQKSTKYLVTAANKGAW